MARNFNGSNTDYIDTTLILNTINNTGDTAKPFSLFAWVRYSTGNTFPMIFCPSAAGSPFLFFGVNIGSGGFAGFNIFYGTGETKNNTAPSNATWYAVLATYNGTPASGLKIYVNGSDLTVGQQGTVNNVPSTNHMQIGNGSNSGNEFWKGRIADMAVWSGVALTAGEAAALASGMRPFQIRQSNLIGWWPIDGIQSPEPDLSGFAHNGTVNGTTSADGPPMTMFTPRGPIFTSPPPSPPPPTLLLGQAML